MSITTDFAQFSQQYRKDTSTTPTGYQHLLKDNIPVDKLEFLTSAIHSVQLQLEQEKQKTLALKQVLEQMLSVISIQAVGQSKAEALKIKALLDKVM